MANNPVQKKSSIISKDGIRTDIICTTYNDRHFIVISQMKKFGTLINAWAENKGDGGKFYDMATLLGRRDDPLLNIYARQLIEKTSAVSDKPLLLAISLLPNGRDTEIFQDILNCVETCNTWQE